MNNSAAHTALKNECLLAHGARPGVRLFNNPVGRGWMGKPDPKSKPGTVTLFSPRLVNFGLAPGSSDIFGIRSVVITPEMVGKTVGQVVAPEVKTGSGRLHDDQPAFHRMINDLGGLAGIIRSPDDLATLLSRPL